jgi:hypothetical protein
VYNGEREIYFTLTDRLINLCSDEDSPGKAYSVLKLMEFAFDHGFSKMLPDLACYRSFLVTCATRPRSKVHMGEIVDQVFLKMDKRFITPDSTCFSGAIGCFKNIAMSDLEVMAPYREAAVQRVLELLAQMIAIKKRVVGADVDISTTNVNDALELLALSSNPKRFERAEQMLEGLELALENGSEDMIPNADSYRLTINVWRTGPSSNKAQQATAILNRMMKNYDALFSSLTNKEDKECIVEVFNAYIDVCGSVSSQDVESNASLFKAVLATVVEMRELKGLQPNSATYTNLLLACQNLIEIGMTKAGVVERIFQLCCDDGMVNGEVLKSVQQNTTPQQYRRMVVDHSELMDGVKMVPEAWTLRVLGGRVKTYEGRKATPLSIDGQVLVTKDMREFKTRRHKAKRDILHGGRLAMTNLEDARFLSRDGGPLAARVESAKRAREIRFETD